MAKRGKKKPTLFKLISETRALAELGSFYTTYPLLKYIAKGDEHPVLVMPGLMSTDYSTGPLRRLLKAKGYKVYGWELGRNYAQMAFIPKLAAKINELYAEHGQKISLVGWSAGGLFARVLGNMMPDKIRQVITLGSPFKNLLESTTNVDGVYEWMTGNKKGDVNEDVVRMIETLPPVPFTSIYTKSDGIVPWENCVEDEVRYSVENVEVFSSHLGLGVNPSVLYCIADRLSQKEGYWEPFETPNIVSNLLYPQFWQSPLKSVAVL